MVKSYEALKVLVLDFSKIQFGPKCKFMYQKKNSVTRYIFPGLIYSIFYYFGTDPSKKRFKYLTYFKFHFNFVFDFKINKFK